MEIDKAKDPAAERARRIAEYRREVRPIPTSPRRSVYIDDIIEPAYTRPKIIAALESLVNNATVSPPQEHGNIPL
jgi:propionyl-CoA carboxylase beta chain